MNKKNKGLPNTDLIKSKKNSESFTVLLSVYSKEKPECLDKALESVFFQTIIPNEVILVEDGKLTKALDNVINKYKKQFSNIFKIVKFSKNRGLGIALHDGIKKCSNEIIFRMDTDDICDKKRFEQQLKIFQNQNVDVVGSNIVEYNEDMTKVIDYRAVPENDREIKKMAKKRNPLNHMTVAYKKSKVLEAGNYVDMKYFEDYYLWIRLIKNNCTFYNVQKNLVKVRCGNNMLLRRGGLEYIKSIYKFEKQIFKLKFINIGCFLTNFIVRVVVSIVPNRVRYIFYKYVLRKK